MAVIYGNYDGDEKAAEIFLSALPCDWVLLSKLIVAEKNEFALNLSRTETKYYPQILKRLKFQESNDKILNLDIIGDDLVLFGNSKARNSFAESLAGCFAPPVPDGFHLHYDYYPDGGGLLGPTEHNLVIGRID